MSGERDSSWYFELIFVVVALSLLVGGLVWAITKDAHRQGGSDVTYADDSQTTKEEISESKFEKLSSQDQERIRKVGEELGVSKKELSGSTVYHVELPKNN